MGTVPERVVPNGTQAHNARIGGATWDGSDGSVRESTSHDLAMGFGKEVTITRDGDGNEINRQDGWGKKD